MDLPRLLVVPLTVTLNKYNIKIIKNQWLNGSSGLWWVQFHFDFEQEKNIEVFISKSEHGSGSGIWTLAITKCHYLGIGNEEQMVTLDIADELINPEELARLEQSHLNDEKLREYLELNVIQLVTKKIKYTRFSPQFRFFLSHKSEDKVIIQTFKNGLKFLGYSTWLDETDMPMGAQFKTTSKTSFKDCDCFVAWLNQSFFESDYCKGELLHARKMRKIILPFGVHDEIKAYLKGDFEFLKDLIFNWQTMSFFEVLRRIDQTLYDFEKMAIVS